MDSPFQRIKTIFSMNNINELMKIGTNCRSVYLTEALPNLASFKDYIFIGSDTNKSFKTIGNMSSLARVCDKESIYEKDSWVRTKELVKN
ncbi:hypothetical protein U3516DRAFT_788062 [Neocallimastix sp. 'constans']